jgi:hypothetical protein
MDGAYTGVSLAQNQPPFTCPYFDGANDFCNIYTAALDAAYSRLEATIAFWVKPYNAAVWSDGVQRRPFKLATTGNLDYVIFSKSTTAGYFVFAMAYNGSAKSVTLTGQSWTAWTHVALTISDSADQFKAYLNGAQAGSTQTGLATPSAGALLSTSCIIGASITTPAEIWNGWIAHVAIWSSALSPTNIANLYNWGLL